MKTTLEVAEADFRTESRSQSGEGEITRAARKRGRRSSRRRRASGRGNPLSSMAGIVFAAFKPSSAATFPHGFSAQLAASRRFETSPNVSTTAAVPFAQIAAIPIAHASRRMERTYGHCVSVRPYRTGEVLESMMDVAVWLRGCGLEQYETLFRDHDIDADVLCELTDGDLEKIGGAGAPQAASKGRGRARWRRRSRVACHRC